MTNFIQSAIVIGATGLVGKVLIEQLNQLEDCEKITAVVRHLDPALSRLNKVQQLLLSDFMVLQSEQVQGYSHAFSCLGTTMAKAGSRAAFYHTDFTLNAHFASLIAETHAHYLLISAMAADPNAYFFYNRVKGELEDYVRELDLRRVSILRPSLLLGTRPEQRPLEQIGQKIYLKFMPLLPKRFRFKPVTADAVAATLIKAAQTQIDNFKIYDNLSILDDK